MRIAVNTLAVVPGVTVSAEVYTTSLIRSLLQTDMCNDYLLILRKDNKHIFPGENDRLVHYVTPVGNGSRVGRVLWEQIMLPWLCRSERIDLVLIPTGVGPIWVPCRSIVVVTMMLAFSMPEVLPPLKRYYYRWLHYISLRQASRVVTLSEQGRRDIQHYLGLDSSRIEVVYPGVAEEFRPLSGNARHMRIPELGEGQDYILAVGPVQPYKNFDLLIHAFRTVRMRGFPHRLIIASGGQPVPLQLKRLVDDIGLKDNVFFLERLLSREEMVTLYSGTALFVHPSSEEQFSLTVLEAMSCGAPVVTSDLPSFREQVGGAGMIVGPGDHVGLCDGILAILSDPVRQKEMAGRSLERACQFSWRACAEKMLAIFEKVST